MHNLERFLEAQKNSYQTAFAEIKAGKKSSHWMWYIFPQIAGLGYSQTSIFYGIENLSEADDYLKHPILGNRLLAITEQLLQHHSKSAHDIFGSPDDLKLKSSMTLFACAPTSNPLFDQVLSQFFGSKRDLKTLMLIGK